MQPPRSVYWSLTNRCAHRCLHCRHDSGKAERGELEEHEQDRVVQELGELGVGVVVLTGGDPLLHPRWQTLARGLRSAGAGVRVHTSLHLSSDHFDAFEAIGIDQLVLSLDGPADVHDRLRPTTDHAGGADHADTLAALEEARRRGLSTRVVTTASRAVLPHLDEVYETLCAHGVHTWQLQQLHLTGRANRNVRELLGPIDTAEILLRLLARVASEGHLSAPMHCSVGWMIPEEATLRLPGSTPPRIWAGSRAGRGGLFISPTGSVRGCPCLPDDWDHPTLRQRSLLDIWPDDSAFPETRGRTSPATGPCTVCRFVESCAGGCTGIALSYTGRITENPRCVRVLRGLDADRAPQS